MLFSRGGCDQRYTLGKLCCNGIVKINKKKPHLNWSWGGPVWPYPTLLHPHHQLPQTKRDILSVSNRKMFFYSTTPAGRRRIFSSPSNHSANERPLQFRQFRQKPLYFKSPVSSNGLFVYNSPPEILFSSIKEHYSCTWFTISLLVPNHNSLLLQNKPFC